jgi:sialidase-1
LLFAAYIHGGSDHSLVIYSDDHGDTWHSGGTSAQGGGESQIAETIDGKILASIRNNDLPEKGVRYFNASADGGITWGMPYSQSRNQSALPDPKCQGSLLTLTSSKKSPPLVMLNAAHPSARSNATLRVSYDAGQTWPASNIIYAGSSAYSALSELSNGDTGILLEIDKYQRIVFQRRKF